MNTAKEEKRLKRFAETILTEDLAENVKSKSNQTVDRLAARLKTVFIS